MESIKYGIHITILQMVQRRFTKIALELRNLNFSQIIAKPNFTTLLQNKHGTLTVSTITLELKLIVMFQFCLILSHIIFEGSILV